LLLNCAKRWYPQLCSTADTASARTE